MNYQDKLAKELQEKAIETLKKTGFESLSLIVTSYGATVLFTAKNCGDVEYTLYHGKPMTKKAEVKDDD